MFDILGLVLIGVGFLIMLGAAIWQLIDAFKQSPVWGIVSLLFCGLGGLVWCVANMKEGWRHLVAFAGGIIPVALGFTMISMQAAIKVVV
ncbi:MAG: hypothetical protein KF858_02350 [Candidatus Sumerlaeia bacterium]|nr:hypothetical protein [Candidatus Sumerlaeia bacterium]